MKHIGAIILAGGKGKRMGMKSTNKVTVALANKPMIQHIVDFMRRLTIEKIVVVVGFAKESVMAALKGQDIIFADQKKRLGTGHAVAVALKALPDDIQDVLVVYGDDAVLYADKHVPIIKQLFETHYKTGAAMTFLTIEKDNPFGLGRIIRNNEDRVVEIAEEKDATPAQRKIREINPGCFVFSVAFLKKYLPKVEKSPVTGEYYVTHLIDIAVANKEKVETVRGGKLAWRGVNTVVELEEAEMLYQNSIDN